MLANSKLLGIDDVVRKTGLSKQYIHRVAEMGKLKYEETSSGKIFLKEDVIAFQKERERKAKTDKRVKLKK